MKSPAFQFYAAEFLADENVVLMSNQEVGCYIKLMAYCWREGSIPSSVDKLAKLCGENSSAMAELWLNIKQCFELANGSEDRLVHPRLEAEREKQAEFKKDRSEAGKKGAAKRWDKGLQDGSAMALSMANNGSSSSTSSSSSNTHTPGVPAQISIVLRKYSINSNPSHPSVIALAEQGVDLETLEACCKETREAKPNETISIGYVLKKLEGWKAQAAQVKVAGVVPAKPRFDNWDRSPAGIERKASELGIYPRAGETHATLAERCRALIQQQEHAA